MIGLLITKGNYAADSLLALGDLPLGFIETSDILGFDSNAFYKFLPSVTEGEIALVTSSYYHTFVKGRVELAEFAAGLRKNFKKLVLLDHADPFGLEFSEEEFELFDEILKVNGVYKDFDLYNFKVGAASPDGVWTEKMDRGERLYGSDVISRIAPSVPCFLGTIPQVRSLVRKFYEPSLIKRKSKDLADVLFGAASASLKKTPPKTVHFIGSLTNIQRKTAVEKLQASALPWKGGIASVPSFVTGLRGFGMAKLSEEERLTLTQNLASMMTKPLNRFEYHRSMLDCKAVLSIAGYGELCFRMAEAYQCGRLLVCQDISHVKTLFPFKNGENVVFCRPDLADLVEILDDVECNFQNKYRAIAERGRADWADWSRNFRTVVRTGFKGLYS